MNKKLTPGLERQISLINAVQASLNEIIVGKEEQVCLTITSLLAQGNILIEGLPGEGKTTLALGLASIFGMDYQRVQFTNDLLPADILGFSIYSREKEEFELKVAKFQSLIHQHRIQ